MVEHTGLARIASQSAVLREPSVARLDNRLLESPPGFLPTPIPFRVLAPYEVLQNDKRPPSGGLLSLVEHTGLEPVTS